MKRQSVLVLTITSILLAISIGAASAAPLAGREKSSISFSATSFSTDTANYAPRPGDEKLTRGPVFIDYSRSQLIVRQGSPTRVSAILRGDLPSPCHQLRIVVTPTDSRGTINIQVYSLFDPNVACVSVLRPFTATFSIGSFSSGTFVVFVNGHKLGEFTVIPPSISSIK